MLLLPVFATFLNMGTKNEAKIDDQSPNKVAKAKPAFKKTKMPSLIMYVATGTYYAYFKAHGKPIKQSLDTTVRSVAEQRLFNLKKQYRDSSKQWVKSGRNMTFGDAVEVYRQRISDDVKMTESNKRYREQNIEALLKSWPGLKKTIVRKITEWDCLNWAKAFSETSSPSRYNHTLGTLRAIIQVAFDDGCTAPHPAMKAEKRRFPTPIKSPALHVKTGFHSEIPPESHDGEGSAGIGL